MSGLTAELRETGARLVARYPVARSALLPLLHLVQAEEGYVTEDGIAFCAEAVGLSKAEVGAVATFYTMFRRRDPGDYLLSVCTNPTCNTGGAQQILQRYKQRLGGDRNTELGCEVESAECLGICDAAPMVQVNYEMYGPLTIDEADALLEACIAKDPPPSHWSGDVPPTFRAFEADIAGVNDGLDDLLAAAARHQASYPVPPAYRTGETDLPVTQPGGDPNGIGGVLAGQQGVPSLFDAAMAAANVMANGSANGAAEGNGRRAPTGSLRDGVGDRTRGAATGGAAEAVDEARVATGADAVTAAPTIVDEDSNDQSTDDQSTDGQGDDVEATGTDADDDRSREAEEADPSADEGAEDGDATTPAEASSDTPDVAEGTSTEGGAPSDSVAAERAQAEPAETEQDAPDATGVGAASDRTVPEGDADADAGADQEA